LKNCDSPYYSPDSNNRFQSSPKWLFRLWGYGLRPEIVLGSHRHPHTSSIFQESTSVIEALRGYFLKDGIRFFAVGDAVNWID
jgi:hypothetical protein